MKFKEKAANCFELYPYALLGCTSGSDRVIANHEWQRFWSYPTASEVETKMSGCVFTVENGGRRHYLERYDGPIVEIGPCASLGDSYEH